MSERPEVGPSRGRGGGRSGGSGYDFQDIYVGLQLASLLLGTHRSDPLREVMWEKKGVEWDLGAGVERLHVDDVVVILESGKRILIDVKESTSRGEWTIAKLATAGVLPRLWQEWQSKTPEDKKRTVLRFASSGGAATLSLLVDVARRARSPAELLSDDASLDVVADLKATSAALQIDVSDPELLHFLKVLEVEPLPTASDLEEWVRTTVVSAGAYAPELATHLVRIVGRSKHSDRASRSSYTREQLVEALLEDGVPEDVLAGIGAWRTQGPRKDRSWDEYRRALVQRHRRFRIYGLASESPVFADLEALFVPLHMRPIKAGDNAVRRERDDRRGYLDALQEPPDEDVSDDDPDVLDAPEDSDALTLRAVLHAHRRFAVIGSPGCGKTTLLRWLAVAAALPGSEGRQARERVGLPLTPLVPVYVRFRQFAERIKDRGLHGVEGRAGLVADFLAAQFEAGLARSSPSRPEAIALAQELLDSESTLLLFDGLDEVPDSTTRDRLFQAVADLLETYRAPTVVLASRPYAFPVGRSPIDLALFQPLPLDGPQRRLFARQWYRSVGRATATGLSESELTQLAKDLARRTESLSELAESPLLLSILALVHFNRRGLAVDFITLYDYATLAVLGNWEREPTGRGVGDDEIPGDWATTIGLDERNIRYIVSFLAYRFQLEDASELTTRRAIDSLTEGFRELAVDQADAYTRADLLLRLLLERSGLLQEISPGIVSFVHLTFQEYLAARWFFEHPAKLDDATALSPDSRHEQVLRMLAAMLATSDSPDAHERAGRFIEAVAEMNPRLAATCLADVPAVKLDDEAAQRLARAVWFENADMRMGYRDPRFVGRALRPVLAQTVRPDRLLLEFLSRDEGESRRFRGDESEMALALLGTRPPGPIGDDLKWFLTKVSTLSTRHHSTGVKQIAELLLVEGGALDAIDAIGSLVRLATGHWLESSSPRGQDPAQRSLAILHELLQDETTANRARDGLSQIVAGTKEVYRALEFAKLLLALGEPLSRSVADGLVRVAEEHHRFEHHRFERHHLERDRFDPLRDVVLALMQQEQSRGLMADALRAGVSSDDQHIRGASLWLLRQVGLDTPILLDPGPEADEEERIEHRKRILNSDDGLAALEALTQLSEDLWDEDPDVSWCAARSLAETSHTTVVGLPQALVRVGLGIEMRRETALRLLQLVTRENPALDPAVRGTLLEATHGSDDRAASSAALHLLSLEKTWTGRRIERLIRAGLRDASQIAGLLAPLEDALSDEQSRSGARGVVDTYLKSKPSAGTVVDLTPVLVRTRCLDLPGVAPALAVYGMSRVGSQSEIIATLQGMLGDQELVAGARHALTAALESSDTRVAWGAAECLWESGSRADKQIPSALVRGGLGEPGRHEEAQTRLLELLAHPRLGRRTRQALLGLLGPMLYRGRGELEAAWEIALCLKQAGMLDASRPLIDSIVRGGFHVTERHEEAIGLLLELVGGGGSLASELKKRLIDLLEDEDADVRWGCVRALTALRVFEPHTFFEEIDEEDEDDQAERERFLAVALERCSEEPAREFIASAQEATMTAGASQIMRKLLEAQDVTVAYRAASWLLTFRPATEFASVINAIIVGGLGDDDLFDDACATLDRLMEEPELRPVGLENLNRALWGSDPGPAWGAARYLGERSTAPLHYLMPGRGEALRPFSISAQIAVANSSNAAASRSFGDASTPSS